MQMTTPIAPTLDARWCVSTAERICCQAKIISRSRNAQMIPWRLHTWHEHGQDTERGAENPIRVGGHNGIKADRPSHGMRAE
jgi:hypothetical protein